MSTNLTDAKLKKAAIRVANVYAKLANKLIGSSIPVPVCVEFDIEKQSLECAKQTGHANQQAMKIAINTTLLRENSDHLLNKTIPHEIAHLAVYSKYDLRGIKTTAHGFHWQECMRILGRVPSEFHTLDVANSITTFKNHNKTRK